MGDTICLGKKVIVELCLVRESKKASNEQVEKEIRESLKCSWLAEVEKVTVKTET